MRLAHVSVRASSACRAGQCRGSARRAPRALDRHPAGPDQRAHQERPLALHQRRPAELPPVTRPSLMLILRPQALGCPPGGSGLPGCDQGSGSKAQAKPFRGGVSAAQAAPTAVALAACGRWSRESCGELAGRQAEAGGGSWVGLGAAWTGVSAVSRVCGTRCQRHDITGVRCNCLDER